MNNQLNLDFRKENSREAREKSSPKAGTDKARILRAMRRHGQPVHARMITYLTDLDYHAVQRRMSELVKGEFIECAGKVQGLSIYKLK